MLVGMAAIAISDAGTALATGLPTLLVARLGLGAGRSLSESGERAFLSDLAQRAPELRGARSRGAQRAVAAAGIAVGAPIGGAVVEEYGAPATFLCVTAAALAALVGYSLPETLEARAADDAEAARRIPRTARVADAWLSGASVSGKGGKRARVAARRSLENRHRVNWVGPDADDARRTDRCRRGLLVTAAVAGLAGAPVAGYATDRSRHRATAP